MPWLHSLKRRPWRPHQAILDGLEHAGLNQARRSFVLRPENLTCVEIEGDLEICFSLGAGEYATSLLMDRFEFPGPGQRSR